MLTADGVRRVAASHCGFGYDASSLRRSDEILLDVTLRLVPGDERQLRSIRRENIVWQARRPPSEAERRSAGCIFRNLPDVSAARLIEAAGLRVSASAAPLYRADTRTSSSTSAAPRPRMCEH